MRLQRQSNGQFINLDRGSVLGIGGEACIYMVPQEPVLVAKVYHSPTDERARKLTLMIANPPEDPMASHGHVSIAWAIDLLRTTDRSGRITGFLMPRLTNMRTIIDFYNPKARRDRNPLFNYRYLIRTARNLAAAVRALHERGYVIGDVRGSNIFVSNTALVTLIDTDSFQVRDPASNIVYRCLVGTPEFTPPELQGKVFAEIDRTPEHDLFGLAVLIFQLLMEGTHPFAGVFQGAGDPPPYEERIAAGHFPYSRNRRMPYRPARLAPPFEILQPGLQQLFMRSFENGYSNPQARPGAEEWQRAMDEADGTLVTCSENDQHLYGNHLKACPWCERAARLSGRDPFPSRQAVQRRQQGQAPAARPSVPSTSRTQQPATPSTVTVTKRRVVAPAVPAKPPPPRRAWAGMMVVSFSLALLLNVLLLFAGFIPWVSVVCIIASGSASVVCGAFGMRLARTLARRVGMIAVLMPGLLAFSLTVMIGFSLIGRYQNPSPEQMLAEQKSELPVTANLKGIIGKDGAEMVLIPAGEFSMGSNDYGDEKPVHTVYLDAFYIDRYEVTNAQYKKFMDATGHKAPAFWSDSKYNAPNHPVVGVSWNDAKAYAEWAGERLPTEAEWEKAARGGLVGKKYPWGDNITHDDANYDGTGGKDVWEHTSPVGSFAPNGYGLYDMAGNAWEWCADWYDSGCYAKSPSRNPTGPDSGSSRVLRGGSWGYGGTDSLRVAYRGFDDPAYMFGFVGFRCAGF